MLVGLNEKYSLSFLTSVSDYCWLIRFINESLGVFANINLSLSLVLPVYLSFSPTISPLLSLSPPGLVMNLLYSGALFTKTPGPSENQTQSALSIQGIQLPGWLLLKKTTAPISLLYKQDYNTKTQTNPQMQACAPALCDTELQNAIHLSPFLYLPLS